MDIPFMIFYALLLSAYSYSFCPDVVVGFVSSLYNVTEQEDPVLDFEIMKDNPTNVSITVEVEKVFMESAFPNCRALGECKLIVSVTMPLLTVWLPPILCHCASTL